LSATVSIAPMTRQATACHVLNQSVREVLGPASESKAPIVGP